MMRHDEIRERLDDFFDGALPPEGMHAVAEHLDGCVECRTELEGMAILQAETRALPRRVAPSRDLWTGIEGRLRPRGASAPTPVIEVDFQRPARRAAGPRRGMLAAAAVVLVALSSGTTAFLMRGGGPAPAPVAVTDPNATAPRPTSALVAFRPTEVEYIGTVQALEAELEARRGQLSPQTVAVIEENLRIIDAAIAEARAALEADPANADLPLHLSGVYRKKVELLQGALQIPSRTI